MNATVLLDKFGVMESEFTTAQVQRNNLIADALVKLANAAPEEFAAWNDAVQQRDDAARQHESDVAELKAQITELTLVEQSTLRGQYYMAVYSKPRVTWDTKGLDGFAVAYPEILAFRKEGEKGSVSFRHVK